MIIGNWKNDKTNTMIEISDRGEDIYEISTVNFENGNKKRELFFQGHIDTFDEKSFFNSPKDLEKLINIKIYSSEKIWIKIGNNYKYEEFYRVIN